MFPSSQVFPIGNSLCKILEIRELQQAILETLQYYIHSQDHNSEWFYKTPNCKAEVIAAISDTPK